MRSTARREREKQEGKQLEKKADEEWQRKKRWRACWLIDPIQVMAIEEQVRTYNEQEVILYAQL